ncbi:MAG: LysR family transcriptional regulator [Bacillota bacterium]|nr:LysR family transcriptional regulator [Bacillota bacterium]
MDIKAIEYVIKIAETKNISKAADELFISQPALSQSLKKIESDMGVSFFRRENNSLSITPAGEMFIKDGKKIVNLYGQIQKKMNDEKNGLFGEITVGSSPYYERVYLSRVIPHFHRMYPGITIRVVEDYREPLEELIVSRKIDLCIMSLPLSIPSIDYYKLFTDRIVLATSYNHPFSKKQDEISANIIDVNALSRLKDENFIMYKQGRRIRSVGLDLCNQAGFSPTIIFESHNCETINSLIADGMGVGFLPFSLLENGNLAKIGRYFSVDSNISNRDFVLAYNKYAYLSNALKVFIEFFKTSGYIIQ